MQCVYILKSIKFGKLYIGCTSDLKKRLKAHNLKENIPTKAYAPYELLFYAVFVNRKDAFECEKYFKTTSGKNRINRMLRNSLR